MAGFILTVSSNNKVWYLIGAIVLTLAMAAVAVVSFISDTAAVGIAFALGAGVGIVFIIDAIANLRR